MKPKIVAALILLVVLPFGVFAWLGLKLAGEEQERLKREYQGFLLNNLRGYSRLISEVIEKRQRQLQNELDGIDPEPGMLDAASRRLPFVTALFYQNSEGKLLYPPAVEYPSTAEQAFLQRTAHIFEGKILLMSQKESTARQNLGPTYQSAQQEKSTGKYDLKTYKESVSDDETLESGWHTWYWHTGLHLLYRCQDGNGGVIGAELNRARLVADIIAELPCHSATDRLHENSRVILAESGNRKLFQWGSHKPGESEQPLAELVLDDPLQSWTLRYYAKGTQTQDILGKFRNFQLFSSLIAVGTALLVLAVFLYRESSREFREAQQRVHFVNQVSHELKTPLTNIRLYAELLGEELPENSSAARKKLEIIIGESGRLGRLINNVLTFSRQQRGNLRLNPRLIEPSEMISTIVRNYLPALEAGDISVEILAETDDRILIDPDVLEQILGNLLGNLEKYAARGKRAIVLALVRESTFVVFIRDFGPGIPHDRLEFVFMPFTRLEDALTEGVSGTGIGLSISRELARIHGGSLEIIWSNGEIEPDSDAPTDGNPAGTCFRLTLAITETKEKHT